MSWVYPSGSMFTHDVVIQYDPCTACVSPRVYGLSSRETPRCSMRQIVASP